MIFELFFLIAWQCNPRIRLRAVSHFAQKSVRKMNVTASVTYERRVEKPRAASSASPELLTARGFAYHARTFMLFCVPSGGSGQHVGFQPRSQGLSSLPPLVQEERPWLQLVTLPPRIWVAKNSAGWEGWRSILFGWCDKLCKFQII